MIRALYPGTFDPFTLGHLDMVQRIMALCDHLTIGIGENTLKHPLFTVSERIAQIETLLHNTLLAPLVQAISVQGYQGATVSFAEKEGISLIVKGLRNAEDYAHEEKMAIVNRRLAPSIDTILLLTDNALRDVSSSAVREIARANIAPHHFDHYLAPEIRDALLERIKSKRIKEMTS